MAKLHEIKIIKDLKSLNQNGEEITVTSAFFLRMAMGKKISSEPTWETMVAMEELDSTISKAMTDDLDSIKLDKVAYGLLKEKINTWISELEGVFDQVFFKAIQSVFEAEEIKVD